MNLFKKLILFLNALFLVYLIYQGQFKTEEPVEVGTPQWDSELQPRQQGTLITRWQE